MILCIQLERRSYVVREYGVNKNSQLNKLKISESELDNVAGGMRAGVDGSIQIAAPKLRSRLKDMPSCSYGPGNCVVRACGV